MATVLFKLEKVTVGVGDFKPLIVELVSADDLLVVVASEEVKQTKDGKKAITIGGLTAILKPLHDAILQAVPSNGPVPITELDEPEEEPKPATRKLATKTKKKDDVDDDLGSLDDLDDETSEEDELGEDETEEEDKPARKSTKEKEKPVSKKQTVKKPTDDDDLDDLAELLAD